MTVLVLSWPHQQWLRKNWCHTHQNLPSSTACFGARRSYKIPRWRDNDGLCELYPLGVRPVSSEGLWICTEPGTQLRKEGKAELMEQLQGDGRDHPAITHEHVDDTLPWAEESPWSWCSRPFLGRQMLAEVLLCMSQQQTAVESVGSNRQHQEGNRKANKTSYYKSLHSVQ